MASIFATWWQFCSTYSYAHLVAPIFGPLAQVLRLIYPSIRSPPFSLTPPILSIGSAYYRHHQSSYRFPYLSITSPVVEIRNNNFDGLQFVHKSSFFSWQPLPTTTLNLLSRNIMELVQQLTSFSRHFPKSIHSLAQRVEHAIFLSPICHKKVHVSFRWTALHVKSGRQRLILRA